MKTALRSLLGWLCCLVLGLNVSLAQPTDVGRVNAEELDAYGGYKGIRLKQTGFFHVEKTDKRHWLVTPDGHAFLSNGINHVEPKWMRKFYNADYWARKYDVVDYTDKGFSRAFQEKVEKDVRYFGWNTLGCHSPVGFYDKKILPYVQTIRFVSIHHYTDHTDRDFPDVFSERFHVYADSLASAVAAPLKNDRYLLGYFMVDCPILTERDAAAHGLNIYGQVRRASPTWPNVIRNLAGNTPGKRAYVEHVKERYKNDIHSFNKIYSTKFSAFSELLDTANWRPKTDLGNEAEHRDNHEFLLKILDRRYAVETAAIKKHDPNHLILGDKLNGNTDTPADILAVAARYVDVLFIQHYAQWDELEAYLNKVARATQKPIMQGDASIHVPYENMPNPYGPHAANQQERIQNVRELFLNAFSRPDVVGWHWCGWMDSWEVGGQAGKQHGGVQDPFGNFHPVSTFLAEFSKKMYAIAQQKE